MLNRDSARGGPGIYKICHYTGKKSLVNGAVVLYPLFDILSIAVIRGKAGIFHGFLTFSLIHEEQVRVI